MAHIEDLWEKRLIDGKRIRTDRYGRGNRWRARYFDPAGKERSKTFPRRIDAEAFLASVEADKARGLYLDPEGAKRRFADYAAQWQRAQVHRPTTRLQVETHLRRHVLPFFGSQALGSVRRSDIQAWVRGREEFLAPATIQVVYRYVAAIFRSAVDDRLIPFSPCNRIVLPRVVPARSEPLSAASVGALVRETPERYQALIVLAAGTGLRQGEAFGLTVDRLDLVRGTVRIDQQLITLPGRDPFFAPPKTTASVRTVPLPETVLEVMRLHLELYAGSTDLVFTGEAGGPIRRTAYSARIWRPAVQRARLPAGTTFHDLRHFYASLLIRHGESVKVVQERLGHASATETLNTYAHLWPDSADRTRTAVDEVLGPSLTAHRRHRDVPGDRQRDKSPGHER